MSRLTGLRSQLATVSTFRDFFPYQRLPMEAIRFALNYLGSDSTRRYPIVININVTNRCDQSCPYCYNRTNTSKNGELSLEEISTLVRQSAPNHAGFFFSGGEPTLREDLQDLVGIVQKHDLPVGLVTNGILLDDSRVRFLSELNVNTLLVSLNGSHGADYTTTQEGSLTYLRHLAGRIPRGRLVLNHVISDSSLHELHSFLDKVLTIENLIVRLVHLSFLTKEEEVAHQMAWTARIGAPPPLLNYRYEVQPEKFEQVAGLLADPRYSRVLSKPLLTPTETKAWYSPGFHPARRCAFLWHSTCINADGSVYPCQYYAYPMGNIRDEPLASIWNNERYRAFRRVIRDGLFPGCSRCCKF